ncbi:MAG: NAD(P)H-hydrate dehydratase [Thermoguttaceae bacterium]|nr:NAD(P)H-hydrate dehydratase [Thermoguttaceae bacterium]
MPTLPARPVDGHKGTFGTALAVGGSRGMSGAISLTGAAALVAGAGLTRLFVPEPILETVAGFAREYTTIPGACDASGRLTSAAFDAILAEAANATALAVGPGFGRSAGATRLIVELFFELERPAVFDADALNALAEAGVFDETETGTEAQTLESRVLARESAVLERGGENVVEEKRDGREKDGSENDGTSRRFAGRKPRGARILTPHPGEFARLTGAKPSSDRAVRIDAATAFAKRLERLFGGDSAFENERNEETQVERTKGGNERSTVRREDGGDAASQFVVALKGTGTVVADGRGAVYVNETGNPNLATGGSGDVLTGVIVGLLAQGAAPFDAARSAVALHGLAADLRATRCSRGAVASDVVRFLPLAFDFYEAAQTAARR